MKAIRPILAVAITLWLAGALQQAVAYRLDLFGFKPDFILATMIPLSICLTRSNGAIVGFFAGLIQGGTAGANLAHYVISRTLTGFATPWSRRFGFELNTIAVGLTGFFATIFAETIFMFLAAPKGIGSFLGDTIRTAIYNGVLAMPVYALLRRILIPSVR